MSLKAAKNAIIAAIKGEFNAGKIRLPTVKAHGGRLDLADLKNLGAAFPAVLVAIAGFGDIDRRDGHASAMVGFVLTVLAADKQGESRADVAEEIAVRLVVMASRKGWLWNAPEVFVTAPGPATAANLYDGKTDATKGVAIVAVHFTQRTRLEETDLSTLDDLLTITAVYDTNADGQAEATDTIVLEGQGT